MSALRDAMSVAACVWTMAISLAISACTAPPSDSHEHSGSVKRTVSALTTTSEVNHALTARVAADSTFPGYSVNRINDGNRDTTVGGDYSWANDFPRGGSLPQSVYLWFPDMRLHGIHRIEIYTSDGYPLQDYTISYHSSPYDDAIPLLSVTGNTEVHRIHEFARVDATDIQITCLRGPEDQTIYGRLNEVELYGPPETGAFLPPFFVDSGMLAFGTNDDAVQTMDYLAYKANEYDASLEPYYEGLSDDEVAEVDDAYGFIEDQSYIDFEAMSGVPSKRAQITAAEDDWLATTSADDADPRDNPDYHYPGDEETRTILNQYGEVRVGSTYYHFNDDGSYYAAPLEYREELLSLRNGSDDPPPHVILHNPFTVIIPPPSGGRLVIVIECVSDVQLRGSKPNGDWKFDRITSIWNYPWQSRVMAKTKSYKKVHGHWKKRKTYLEAQVWGHVHDSDCYDNEPVDSGLVPKTHAKKVKAPGTAGRAITINSGDIQSYHYSAQVGGETVLLAW